MSCPVRLMLEPVSCSLTSTQQSSRNYIVNMNIFKRIGSFASNSWREFCEYQDTKEEHGKISALIQDNDCSKTNLVEKKATVNEENVIRRRSFQGLFHKRASRKKLLEDPRSPSTAIIRTPMPEKGDESFEQGMFHVCLFAN